MMKARPYDRNSLLSVHCSSQSLLVHAFESCGAELTTGDHAQGKPVVTWGDLLHES